MGCHFLLQGVFPTQGSNLHLLHWQADSFTTEPLGEPCPPIYVYTNFTAEWFIIAKQVKQPQCLSTCEWINYMSYTLTIEYYLAREKLLTHAIRWMNLKRRLNKRSQSQQAITVRFLLYEMTRRDKFIGPERRLMVARTWEMEKAMATHSSTLA